MLFLGALLLLDKEALGLFGLSLVSLFLGLFVSGCVGCLFVVLASLFIVLLGEPRDEVGDEGAHGVLRLAVIELALTVKLELLAVPLREELALDDAVIVQSLAQSSGELLLIRISVDEELNDGLEEILHTIVSVLVGQGCEDGLELAPVLNDVAMWAEDTAHANVELVLRRHVQSELNLACFLKNIVSVDLASGFLLAHEVLHLLASSDYKTVDRQRSS